MNAWPAQGTRSGEHLLSRCECCQIPTWASEGEQPLICSTCHMVHGGLRYRDGSGPQDRLTFAEVERIKQRVFELRSR